MHVYTRTHMHWSPVRALGSAKSSTVSKTTYHYLHMSGPTKYASVGALLMHNYPGTEDLGMHAYFTNKN